MLTPRGQFRLRADSSALAAWAKASAQLPAPEAPTASAPDAPKNMSASILRASDQSGNAMRLMRLSGDSASVYQLAASNGAWEFADRISPEHVATLLTALRGEEGNGVAWRMDVPPVRELRPGYKPAEMAPGNPRPEYPPHALINLASGEVVAAFVVGVDGRAQMGTLLIVSSTHPLFSLAVRNVLPSMRFVPASVDGRPVPQVVSQKFEFRFR
jgi:hypothetical protein